MDLTAIRSDDVQRVIEVVESDLQAAHGLIPLSEWIDRPALAVVYQPHAGWIVVSGGIGSAFLLGIELSRQLKTNVLAMMSANLHAAGFRIFGSGCEDACYEISLDGYGGMSDPIVHFATLFVPSSTRRSATSLFATCLARWI